MHFPEKIVTRVFRFAYKMVSVCDSCACAFDYNFIWIYIFKFKPSLLAPSTFLLHLAHIRKECTASDFLLVRNSLRCGYAHITYRPRRYRFRFTLPPIIHPPSLSEYDVCVCIPFTRTHLYYVHLPTQRVSIEMYANSMYMNCGWSVYISNLTALFSMEKDFICLILCTLHKQ